MSLAAPTVVCGVPDISTILIVDDEEDIRDLIADNLAMAGFNVLEAADGLKALRLARELRPDLILLDLMLPEMDGFAVLHHLKDSRKTAGIPIIMLTAKGTQDERIEGLAMGADDYVSKPFSPKELVLRVKAVLRRTSADSGMMTHGPLKLDKNKLMLMINGAEIELTATEFKLLLCLMESPGESVGRSDLLQRVWGYGDHIQTRTLDTHVKRLREKLGDEGDQIETVRGVGYRLSSLENESS
ncbi:MAG: two-component system phosphate regulon response regulator PhoB [Verrucomicrobiales bacterium]